MSEVTLPHNWRPRDYQGPMWEYMLQDKERLRGVSVWHRRAGKDLFGINVCATKAFQRPGVYWHLLPTYKQGRAIVWNGMDKEGRKFTDYFPEHLVTDKNETEMRIKMMTHDRKESIYQVIGTDNPDLLVGTNPVGCIFSEYSLQDPSAWDYIRPILAENGGWALFIYTPRGPNHGLRMRDMAKSNKNWFLSELSVTDTNAVSEEVIEDERNSGMSEEMIQQEFYISFEAPMSGSYYGAQMMDADDQKRLGCFRWEPTLPVNTYWDLGMDDATAIVFVQSHAGEERIIDYYEQSGEGLAHYAKFLKEKPYTYHTHFAPWDIVVRELGTGESRQEIANRLGIRFRVVSKHDLMDGIEAVRNLLPRCWFDTGNTQQLIDSLRNYHKSWDEKRKVHGNRPEHDWSSHGADAMRTFAMSQRLRGRSKRKRQTHTIDHYQYI